LNEIDEKKLNVSGAGGECQYPSYDDQPMPLPDKAVQGIEP